MIAGHAPAVQRLERRRQRVERAAQLGHGHHARARCPSDRLATSRLEPFTLSTSSAPAATAVRISAASKRVDADAHARRPPARGPRRRAPGYSQAGRAADVDDVGAGFAKRLGGGAHVAPAHLRRVVDLGQDLDVVGAVVAPRPRRGRRTTGSRAGPSAPCARARRRRARPRPTSPSHSPGISTRSTPGGHRQEARHPLGGHQRGHGDLQHRHVVGERRRHVGRACGAAPARPAGR